MEAEQTVTKLLTEQAILKKRVFSELVSNPVYNLGDFLSEIKNAPSPYGAKYMFVK